MGNNSGFEHTVINTRERAVSTDINRLQQQAARDSADLLSRWANDVYTDQKGLTWNVAHEEVQAVDGAPLRADIYGGLRIRPFSTFLLVSPGTLGVKATPGTPDAGKDSDYIIVNDPGVSLNNVLLFVANGGGSLRVDIVECAVVDTVLTSESRDIYDPVTGLFTASLVTKTAAARLSYRIRQGVAGAGFPVSVVEWLPLAVAIHQIGSANFDDVDFYDVRPLVHDRTNAPSARGRAGDLNGNQHFWQGVAEDAGEWFIGGSFVIPNGGGPAISLADGGGYKCEGIITPTLPGQDTSTDENRSRIRLDSADYFCPGVSLTHASRWLYLLSMQPFGLPRWRRYSLGAQSSGEREPGPNFGLLCIADDAVAKVTEFGISSAVTLPVGYGMSNATERSRMVGLIRQSPTAGDYIVSSITAGNFFALAIPLNVTATDGGFGGIKQDYDYDLSTRGGGSEIIPAWCSGFRADVNARFGVSVATAPDLTFSTRIRAGSTVFELESNMIIPGPLPIDTNYQVGTTVDHRIPADDYPNAEGGPLLVPITLESSVTIPTGTFAFETGLARLTGFWIGY